MNEIIKKQNKQSRTSHIPLHTSNNGITLIALVITIIVMLILVAVTISLAINGGLFGYAGNAARDTELAKHEEQNIANIESGLSTDDLIAVLTGQEIPKPAYASSLLDENGVLTKNAIYTDANSNKIVEIPKGFGIVEDYNIINQGLVISDQFDNNGNSIGNEFVWIPVEFTAEGDENENGLDDAFEAVFYKSGWSYNARNNPIENTGDDPTGKYNQMMLSVQEHKGFYIGRYETGEIENGNVVVKRDKKPYTSIKWGDSTTEIGTTGAVYLSQNMYTGESHNVTSTLCYGEQWDAMLDFIIKNDNGTHNVTSSSNWGNYSDTNANTWKITRTTAQYFKTNRWYEITEDLTKEVAGNVKLTTGANDNFQAKNIYDVAGNVDEWTLETNQSSPISRGGRFTVNGGSTYAPSAPAASRSASNIIGDQAVGFRIALYL